MKRIFLVFFLISGILLLVCCPEPSPVPSTYAFSLAASTDGNGSGNINTSESTATGSYAGNTTVTASASPAAGSVFGGWYNAASGGTVVSSDNPYSFPLTADIDLFARFNLVSAVIYTFSLGVQEDGTGGGTINAGASTANGDYDENTSITASASPSAGSEFVGWYDASSGGSLASVNNPYIFVLGAETHLFARFNLIPPTSYAFSLGIEVNGSGGGTINAGASTANGDYDENTSITAAASPSAGSEFVGWYDASSGGSIVSGDNPFYFLLTADSSFFARFDLSSAPEAGDLDTFLLTNSTLQMHYCPGGTFPVGTDDAGEATFGDFWIGETEVTYGLWEEIYQWATDDVDRDLVSDDDGSGDRDADGGVLYHFENGGQEGHDGDETAVPTAAAGEPATDMSWRDALVWCNALSEYFGLNPVYTVTGAPIADSRDANADQCDDAVADPSADGFRLLESLEWECAARWKGSDSANGAIEKPAGSGEFWTPGNYASGATDDHLNITATQAAAWYSSNSGFITHNVGLKPAAGNALGLFDMSGNVSEWCFDTTGLTGRVLRGGNGAASAAYTDVGYEVGYSPQGRNVTYGFRLARNR